MAVVLTTAQGSVLWSHAERCGVFIGGNKKKWTPPTETDMARNRRHRATLDALDLAM